MKEIFTKSEKFAPEYSVRIHRMGELYDVPDSDFLAYTIIGGDTVVVRKDDPTTKPGQVVLFVTRECVLNTEFLVKNNQYMFDKYQLNDNADEITKMLDEAEKIKETEPEKSEELVAQTKRMCGYFGENGRVRIKALRGVASSGYIFTLDAAYKWKPELKSFFDEHPLESFIPEDGSEFMFDTIDGELFVWPYVPKINKQTTHTSKRGQKLQKRLKKFDRVDPDHFAFHYRTEKLGDNIYKIRPDDVISLSVKLHGTSFIAGNVLQNSIIVLPFYKKLWNMVVDNIGLKKYRCADSFKEYGNIYSSRKVVQNGSLKMDGTDFNNTGYYDHNVYHDINEIVKEYIPKGMTIYGEIVGYVEKGGKHIQKGYDYGCDINGVKGPVNKLMIYRINEEKEDGRKVEWNISEVVEWSKQLLDKLPAEHKERLMILPVLYYGKACELYPELDVENHWHENLIIAMKNDREKLGMEEKETLCSGPKKKLPPREGIVLRVDVDHDIVPEPAIATEAFKLKTDAFAKKEAEQYDAGEVDVETAEAEYSGPEEE